MSYAIVDADGHVIETNEGVARYLDEPFRRRPLNFSLYPQDGWDRRLLGTLGDQGSTVEQWLRALDRGGMEQSVLYPTLGLFLSFLKDRQWAVAICRAYNTFLHEEFTTKTPRLRAVALDTDDVLLKTQMSAGHGGVSGRYNAWRERAFTLAWILDRMGRA